MIKGGRLPKTYFKVMHEMVAKLENELHQTHCKALLKTLQNSLMWMAGNAMKDADIVGAAATPMLKLFSLTTMGVMWATMANTAAADLTSGKYSEDFYQGKLKAADHFFRTARAQADLLQADIQAGKGTLMNFTAEQF
jgi:hypothetical protein